MKKLFTLPCYVFLLLSVACVEFDEPALSSESDTTSRTRAGSDVPIFDTLPNPYALDVMQEIYDMGASSVILQPTDLYVRFLPQDTTQLNALRSSGLELFDFPLDLKIEEGQEYVDPDIPEGEPGWFYTTVKPNFEFPEGFVYEILEECYIPEEGETVRFPATRAGEGENIVDLERAAFERMGYKLAPQTRANVKPRGKIQVWDNSVDSLNWVGVKGVKIRCHVVVKWSTTYTREDGSYTMGRNFAIGPHYAIVYDNIKDFTIWGQYGFLAAANHNMGWHSQSGHNENIGAGWSSWDWAVINNAAYDYYDMCKDEDNEIMTPPSNLRIWAFRDGAKNTAPMLRRVSAMQYLTKDNWATYLAWGTATAGVVLVTILDGLFKWAEPDVIIGTKDKNTYRSIYEVVNHELAHASHFSKVGSNYWSKYISHIIAKLGYGDDGSGTNAGVCEVGEMWGNAIEAIQAAEYYNDTTRLSRSYSDNGYWYSWIRPDPLWALITRGVLSKKQVFDCLTVDVNTKAKLIAKMCSKYPDKETLIRMAFAINDIITSSIIDGEDYPIMGNEVAYAANMPNAVSFSSWTFPGKTAGVDYRIASGTATDYIIGVKFLSASKFTLTANFTLPDGSTFSVSREINVPRPYPGRLFGSGYCMDSSGTPNGYTFDILSESSNAALTYTWEINTGYGWEAITPVSKNGGSAKFYPAGCYKARYRRGVKISPGAYIYSNELVVYDLKFVSLNPSGEVWETFVEIITNKLPVDPNSIYPYSKIIDDLGADSLDAFELIMDLEDEFGIEIAEEDAQNFVTVWDAVEYICVKADLEIPAVSTIPPILGYTEITSRLMGIVAEHFSVPALSLSLETNLYDEFGVDSLDQVELAIMIENEFDIEINVEPEAAEVQTIGDIYRLLLNILL